MLVKAIGIIASLCVVLGFFISNATALPSIVDDVSGFFVDNYTGIFLVISSFSLGGIVAVFLSARNRKHYFDEQEQGERDSDSEECSSICGDCSYVVLRDINQRLCSSVFDVSQFSKKFANEIMNASSHEKLDEVEIGYHNERSNFISDFGEYAVSIVCDELHNWYSSEEIKETFRGVIKLVHPSSNDIRDWMVSSTVWDRKTLVSQIREKIKNEEQQHYAVKDNTALETLALDLSLDSWICNDLKQMQAAGTNAYKNHREDWAEDYNAKLVIPLRWCRDVGDESYQFLMGFLSIDCQNKREDRIFVEDESYSFYICSCLAYALTILMYDVHKATIDLDGLLQEARSRVESGVKEDRRWLLRRNT